MLLELSLAAANSSKCRNSDSHTCLDSSKMIYTMPLLFRHHYIQAYVCMFLASMMVAQGSWAGSRCYTCSWRCWGSCNFGLWCNHPYIPLYAYIFLESYLDPHQNWADKNICWCSFHLVESLCIHWPFLHCCCTTTYEYKHSISPRVLLTYIENHWIGSLCCRSNSILMPGLCTAWWFLSHLCRWRDVYMFLVLCWELHHNWIGSIVSWCKCFEVSSYRIGRFLYLSWIHFYVCISSFRYLELDQS